MVRAQPREYFAANHRAVANAIEWEEMPSLTKRLVNRERGPMARGANDSRWGVSGFETTWGETMPAYLDNTPPSSPFVERMQGLATREVLEPGIFKHFFGPHADR